MEKKKISQFEFAIMEFAEPARTSQFEPYTHEEEFQQRMQKIRAQEKRLLQNTRETIKKK